MPAESVTRRADTRPAGRDALGWGAEAVTAGISPRETPNRGGGRGLIALSNKLLTESNIFQFVMT